MALANEKKQIAEPQRRIVGIDVVACQEGGGCRAPGEESHHAGVCKQI